MNTGDAVMRKGKGIAAYTHTHTHCYMGSRNVLHLPWDFEEIIIGK
jgi:hypothetical protein